MDALEASAGQDTGKASRAGQAAMAGQETREANADPGTREAMADPGTREAMALFFPVAKAGQGAPWPWPKARPPTQRIYGPPKKKLFEKFPSGSRSGGAGSGGRSGGAGS